MESIYTDQKVKKIIPPHLPEPPIFDRSIEVAAQGVARMTYVVKERSLAGTKAM